MTSLKVRKSFTFNDIQFELFPTVGEATKFSKERFRKCVLSDLPVKGQVEIHGAHIFPREYTAVRSLANNILPINFADHKKLDYIKDIERQPLMRIAYINENCLYEFKDLLFNELLNLHRFVNLVYPQGKTSPPDFDFISEVLR
jgi:hypothetical protein